MLHQRTRPLPDAEPFLHTSQVADILHVSPQDDHPLGQGRSSALPAHPRRAPPLPEQAIQQLAASLVQEVRAS
jgi:hypothetical protein